MSFQSILSRTVIKKASLGALLEFSPIVIFLVAYLTVHVYAATFVLMVATIISTVLTYVIQRRLPYFALYVALITVIFGYLTLLHHNPKMLQVRDTLYDVTLAATLVIAMAFRVNILRTAFHEMIPMSVQAWNSLRTWWICFFVAAAAGNEFVRHHVHFGEWLVYKTVMIFATVVFGIIVFVLSYQKDDHMV